MLRLYPPPQNEAELFQRCSHLEGITFAQLASLVSFPIPREANQRKGWTGQALELALGTSAGAKALPDFHHLKIELKTIPFNQKGKPSESTFITTISLLTIHTEQWQTSQCYQKLRRILWIPIEGEKSIPFVERRIGKAKLWSPNVKEESILASDWSELVTFISTGKLEQLDAARGNYLQVRPKAANGRSICYGFNEEGQRILTLPRGFYLRSRFTATIF